MTYKLSTLSLIALADEKAPNATLRSSAESCVEDARKALARGDDTAARMWAQHALDYSIGVFQARAFATATA